VSTVKKSIARTLLAWARRNCRHVSADRLGAGSTPPRCRMAQTVLAPSVDPSRHSSPWTRRYPSSGSPWPAAAPDRGSLPPRLDDHAGVGRSNGPGPGRGAIPAAWSAAPTVPATPSGAAAAPVEPAPHGQPSPSGVGPSAGAAPQPRGAAAGPRHPWLPSFASAAQATPSPCRTSGTSVAGSSTDHRDQVTALANSQLSTHDRLSGTHRLVMDATTLLITVCERVGLGSLRFCRPPHQLHPRPGELASDPSVASYEP
jgi:hypothetical protein